VTGRRTLADDVAQEAFVRAISSLDRFDPSRPFAPWLTRIAVNAALDELRRERRLDPEQPTTAQFAADTPAAVVRAVARLAPERRLIVALHYSLDYPTPEIARVLDLPLGTVASRLSRAPRGAPSRPGGRTCLTWNGPSARRATLSPSLSPS
jgi:RNA polymerase sigma-70 factor (ECF subfamily)